MSRPSKWIDPDEGLISQVSILKKVLLPAPFGPMTPRSSPCSREKLISLFARQPAVALRQVPDLKDRACDLRLAEVARGRRGRAEFWVAAAKTGESSPPPGAALPGALAEERASAIRSLTPPRMPRRRKETSRTKTRPSASFHEAPSRATLAGNRADRATPPRRPGDRTASPGRRSPSCMIICPDVSKVKASGGI